MLTINGTQRRSFQAASLARRSFGDDKAELRTALARPAHPKSGADLEVLLFSTSDLAEFRAGAPNFQSGTLVTGGGYTVPETMAERIEVSLQTGSPLRRVATIERVPTGRDYIEPTANDTVSGEALGENVLTSEGDVTFGAVVFHFRKFSSKRVILPAELLEDTIRPFADRLGELLGLRIARIFNQAATIGNAALRMRGIVNEAALAVTAASTTAIAGDELFSLVDAVDPAYREDPDTCQFMMHSTVLKLLLQLKDGGGRYLFPPRLKGQPYMIAGHEVVPNNHMASALTASAIPILFGRFDKVLIKDCNEMRLRIFTEASGLAENDQAAYLGILRSDCHIIDAGTHPIASLQMHS